MRLPLRFLTLVRSGLVASIIAVNRVRFAGSVSRLTDWHLPVGPSGGPNIHRIQVSPKANLTPGLAPILLNQALRPPGSAISAPTGCPGKRSFPVEDLTPP